MYDAASTVLQQQLSQIDGIGQVIIGGSALPAVRVELNPHALFKYGIGLEDVRAALASANANSPKGAIDDGDRALSDLHQRSGDQGGRLRAAGHRLSQRRCRCVCPTSPTSSNSVEDVRNDGVSQRQAVGHGHSVPPARRQHHRHHRQREGRAAAAASGHAGRRQCHHRHRPQHHDPCVAARHRDDAGDRRSRW